MRIEPKRAAVARVAAGAERGRVLIGALFLVFLLGAASFAFGVSAESARPDFALLTVSFLFLLGITQAGVVFSATMRLVRADWAKRWYRFAELSTMAFSPFAIAGLLLIFLFGRDELFYWLQPDPGAHLSPWLSIDWLLVRNLGGLLLFYGLSAVYAWKALRPDLPDRESADDHDERERQLYLMSPFVLLAFVLSSTFIAWDFAMMLIPHWHSTVFPIHFWFGNVFAGSAALVVFALRERWTGVSAGLAASAQIKYLGMLLTAYALMWLYFFWAQFFVIWFGNLPQESEPVWRQMYGHYAPYFWSMLTGCFFLPFVAFIFAIVKRSLAALCVIALAINAGIWLNKYLMIVPVFSPDDVPFDRWIDVALAVGLLAGFAGVLALALSRLPNYSYWELGRAGVAESGQHRHDPAPERGIGHD